MFRVNNIFNVVLLTVVFFIITSSNAEKVKAEASCDTHNDFCCTDAITTEDGYFINYFCEGGLECNSVLGSRRCRDEDNPSVPSGCGSENAACCTSGAPSICNSGLHCSFGADICVAVEEPDTCGGEGQLCCQDDSSYTCNSGLECYPLGTARLCSRITGVDGNTQCGGQNQSCCQVQSPDLSITGQKYCDSSRRPALDCVSDICQPREISNIGICDSIRGAMDTNGNCIVSNVSESDCREYNGAYTGIGDGESICRISGSNLERYYNNYTTINGTEACYDYESGVPVLDDNGQSCISCYEQGGLWVAIGCVDPTPLGIITGLIRIAFGVMGGVVLIQLIIAGVMYQKGDEAGIEKAKSQVLATLSGIALLVFSVLALRIIGVNVLDVLPQGSV